METTNLNRRHILQLLTATLGGAMLMPANAFAQPESTSFMMDPKPVLIEPGAGEKGKFGGVEATFKLNKAQTASNLGSVEMILKPGFMAAPPHLHKGFDEICIVQEGTLHILVGNEVMEAKPGSWHLRPRNMIHTFWNSGKEPAKFTELYTPGGFEDYLKDLSKLFARNPDPQPKDLDVLLKKHDMILRFDLLPAIMKKYNVHL